MLSVKDPLEFFNAKYRSSADPWCVGEIAQRKTYQEILRIVGRLKRGGYGAALDVGCGTGHLSEALAAFSQRVVGTDIAETAIAQARRKHADRENLAFHLWDVRLPPGEDVDRSGPYDLVLCSEVLYYYAPDVVAEALARLRGLLAPDGYLVLVHSTEGPRYNLDELVRFTVPHFAVLETGWIENHAYIVAVTPRPYLALTLDYEAFEYPRKPDIEREVIRPTARLLDLADAHGARLSLFVEVGEMMFWDRFAPGISGAMRDQVRDAYLRGHDVQLHLHPRWLPQWGTTYNAARDRIYWDLSRGYLGALDEATLREVLGACHRYLCELVAPVDPRYRPTVFRAGKYQITPHGPIFRVLKELGYEADSSVWKGGYKATCEGMPGFDFRYLWTAHEPFWPAPADVNLPAAAEDPRSLLELPIASDGTRVLSLDRLDADAFCSLLAKLAPTYAVAIGHPKCLADETHARRVEEILRRVRQTHAVAGIRHLVPGYVTTRSPDLELQRHEAAVAYYHRVLPSLEEILAALASYNRGKRDHAVERIDRFRAAGRPVRVLDYGCGTGELFTVPLAAHYRDHGDVSVCGFDVDETSLLRARAHASRNCLDNLTFCGDRTALEPVGYDLVTCLEVIEHMEDPAPLLADLAGLVRPGGCVYVTVPNGYGPKEYEAALIGRLMRGAYRHPLLLKLGAYLKRRLKAVVFGRRQVGDRLPVTATANAAKDIHVQFFRFGDVPRLAAQCGLVPQRSGNTAFLLGVSATLLERMPLAGKINAMLGPCVPSWLASGWWYDFQKG